MSPDLYFYNINGIPEVITKQHLLPNKLCENTSIARFLLASCLQ